MPNPVSSPCEDITLVSQLIEAAGRIVEAKGPGSYNHSCAFAYWQILCKSPTPMPTGGKEDAVQSAAI